MSELSLPEKVLAISSALDDAGVPHAFGGALALAYYAEPRATIDIDVNVFVTVDRFGDVAAALTSSGVPAPHPALANVVRRDGQGRLMWGPTPIDLFFLYDRFHEAAAAARRIVPFAERSIPILSVEHLVACKVVFNRPKDWVDVDAILEIGTSIEASEVLRWVGRTVGDDDPRFDRAVTVLTMPPKQ